MNGVASLQYATDLISFPLAELLNSTDASMKSLDNVALFLGALTAGGGITGYVRTGSVPSVAAGVTVGALVWLSLSICLESIFPERFTGLSGRYAHSETGKSFFVLSCSYALFSSYK